jgi:hypothetical protein
MAAQGKGQLFVCEDKGGSHSLLDEVASPQRVKNTILYQIRGYDGGEDGDTV